jgi:hypothetical protein
MSPRAFDCPTCLAPPMVECRAIIDGRCLTRAEKALYLGDNADGCAILNQPAGIVHIERANMANRAEKAARGKTDPDWNTATLYAEQREPEPERRATGRQTTIIRERE